MHRRTSGNDLRHLFEKYGEVRDVYIPRDFHTGKCRCMACAGNLSFALFNIYNLPCCSEPRGFAFVEFLDARDARDAQRKIDGMYLDGRELTVIFAQVRHSYKLLQGLPVTIHLAFAW